MDLRPYKNDDSRSITELFKSVFTDSEGADEGILIGQLSRDMLAKTDKHDLFNFVADDHGHVIASIFFSRLTFDDNVEAFILSPVAVHSAHQGKRVGQALINYGLSELKKGGVRFALTYGDPNFYSKVGFRPISSKKVRPPFQLSQPQGWLGQSLASSSIETLSGNCICVDALNDPVYW